MEHAEFPDDETLAAFIDGGLDETTRKEVVAHVANCEECYSTVLAARAWKQSEEPAAVVTHARFAMRRWAAALAVAAAAAGVFFLTPEVRDRSAMHSLVTAANERRERPAAELPLSGEFSYRPAAHSTRGDNDQDVDPRVQEAAADVAERAEKNPTRRNLHARGLALLLVGHSDEAVNELARAAGGRDALARCNDVSLLIDLGAAAFANRDYPLSFAAYKRATALAPGEPAAKFGLARTLEDMNQREEAKAAFNDYLKLDPNSGWAGEARRSLERLKEPE